MIKIILNDIRNLKIEVRIQLEQCKSISPSDSTARELKTIFHELDAIEEEILDGEVPPRKRHYSDLYRAVTDAWGIDSELGDKLLEFANKYKEYI